MSSEPPFQLMTLIEELLQKFGPGALNILKLNSINIVSYAWPLFETGFARVLPEKSWRQLWDHIIVCNKTAFFGVCSGCLYLLHRATYARDVIWRQLKGSHFSFDMFSSQLECNLIFRPFSQESMMLIWRCCWERATKYTTLWKIGLRASLVLWSPFQNPNIFH